MQGGLIGRVATAPGWVASLLADMPAGDFFALLSEGGSPSRLAVYAGEAPGWFTEDGAAGVIDVAPFGEPAGHVDAGLVEMANGKRARSTRADVHTRRTAAIYVFQRVATRARGAYYADGVLVGDDWHVDVYDAARGLSGTWRTSKSVGGSVSRVDPE